MVLALAMAILPATAHAQRRQSTQRAAASTASPARFDPAPGRRTRSSLNNQQRAVVIHEMIGVLVDAAALEEPVRMSVNYPAHAGGRVIVSVEGAVANPGPDVDHPGFWILRTTSMDVDVYESQLLITITRPAFPRQVLVDCSVNAPHGADLKLMDLKGSTQLLSLAGPGHILSVLPPPVSDTDARHFLIKMARPSSNMYVDYCEVTAMK